MRESQAETTFGITAVIAGLGVVTMALFPFALPILVLLAPLALPLVPLLLLATLFAPIVLAVRAVGRRRRARRARPAAGRPTAASPRLATAGRHRAG